MALKSPGTDLLLAPCPWGDLLDRITILEIKAEKATDDAKRANVEKELKALSDARDAFDWKRDGLDEVIAELSAVNRTLWDIEDDIRDCEANEDFGERFIELARSVYKTNDRRAALKRRCNEILGSALMEEKLYKEY